MSKRWSGIALVPMTVVAMVAVVGGSACGDGTTKGHADTTAPDTADVADAADAPDVADAVETTDAVDTVDRDEASPDAIDAADATPDVVEDIVVPPDREAGARAPLTASCDDAQPARCFLPWPSSVFLTRDATRATGVRLAPDATQLVGEGVELVTAAGADGFSRVTPLVTMLPLGADDGTVTMRLFEAEPGDDFGREVPLDTVVVHGRDANDPGVLVGYSLAPLRPGAEHVVVVTTVDSATAADPARHAAAVALGDVAPTTQAEAARVAYFAPERDIVERNAIAHDHVAALWDFVTRSGDDARAPLNALATSVKAAVDAGAAHVVLTSAVPGQGPIALIVEGHLDGLVDDTVTPLVDFVAPFRVVVPVGTGDYHVVMYGHGTGGDVHETSFDELIAGSGAAKINTEIDGWTADTVAGGLGGLLVPVVGTRDLTLRMRRSIAGIAAIQRALLGPTAPLAALLAADAILDAANPVAGRHPLNDAPIWAGGSLGGVIGCVYGHLEPTIAGGILNVPGAAFTHWLARSSLGGILDIALAHRYPAMVDQQLVAAMSQTLWDEVDGAAWADARAVPPIFIVQMSVGDPIMPNIATEMVATSLHAVMLLPAGGAPMVPVPGIDIAQDAHGRTALTEFKTNETSNNDIHGFAARDAPAGLAARAQFQAFIATLWAGTPTITIPDSCEVLPDAGICDFSGVPLPE